MSPLPLLTDLPQGLSQRVSPKRPVYQPLWETFMPSFVVKKQQAKTFLYAETGTGTSHGVGGCSVKSSSLPFALLLLQGTARKSYWCSLFSLRRGLDFSPLGRLAEEPGSLRGPRYGWQPPEIPGPRQCELTYLESMEHV